MESQTAFRLDESMPNLLGCISTLKLSALPKAQVLLRDYTAVQAGPEVPVLEQAAATVTALLLCMVHVWSIHSTETRGMV